jgi:Tol biopolymer transport system component
MGRAFMTHRKFPFLVKLLGGLFLSQLVASCGGYPEVTKLPFSQGREGVNTPASEFHPEIADRYVAFVSDRNGSQDIYLYDQRDQNIIELPGLNSLDEMAFDPTVSEDGRLIAFTQTRQGQSDIYLYNRETRSLRNLTNNLAAQVRRPTISADGSTVAFEANPDGNWDILVYDSSGRPLDLPQNN